MRPWRDIFSMKAWEEIVQKTDSTAHISKMKSLKAVFDSGVNTPSRALAKITPMIRTYHGFAKSSYANLPKRIAALSIIRQLAEDYMQDFRVNADKAKERVVEVQLPSKDHNKPSEFTNAPVKRNPNTGRYDVGDPYLQTLDRNILSLQNRSYRKAEYLSMLKEYYSKNSQDPNELVRLLTAPQSKGADYTGLAPGVRMEALDPWHRPVEVQFNNGNLNDDDGGDENSASAAFTKWYKTIANHQTPFFLWLEDHPICTADSKEAVSGTATVNYLDPKDAAALAAAGTRHKLAMVYARNGLLWMDEMRPNGFTRIATTAGYTCDSAKGVGDAAAFVWTGREIIIAQHQESAFHHSSFNSGKFVKCAGMLKLNQGRVVYVSNNSGHYKPGKNLLFNFVQEMVGKGLMPGSANVDCFGVNPIYRKNATQFLSDYAKLR
jgi:hypothetical protein